MPFVMSENDMKFMPDVSVLPFGDVSTLPSAAGMYAEKGLNISCGILNSLIERSPEVGGHSPDSPRMGAQYSTVYVASS
jgi:hypothetical protein